MMLLDLICYDCIVEQVDEGAPYNKASEPILTPFEQVNDSGIYEVKCSKGHNCKTIIDNIDFEILFEYGLNSLVDGYYRESVSSFTSAMERFHEFFIKTVLRAAGMEFDKIDITWKNISSQSERQLGAYITVYAQTFKKAPPILNTNKEIPFRNAVIHKGKIPSKEEAIKYGNRVLNLIEASLILLKIKHPKEVKETFKNYGYRIKAESKLEKNQKESGTEEGFAIVNIMTTIDVMHGRELNENDGRKGDIECRLLNILDRRNPRKLMLVKDDPTKTGKKE